MTKACYIYEIKSYGGHQCIVIVDQNKGGMSVTNDIENVVADIARKENLNPIKHPIVYLDSNLTWDGWDALTNTFVPLNEKIKMVAIDRMATIFRHKQVNVA